MRVSQFFAAALSVATFGLAGSAFAALTAGDIAIIGRTNNATPDSFTFVLLADVALGEEIYFTDNGWTGTGFRSGSVTDGNGNESLLKFTADDFLSAGTIIRSNEPSLNADYTFTTSGLVPGATNGNFENLAFAQGGEQITAFQAPTNLPLQNPSSFLFLLDDTNGFEPATSASTGSVPSGLTAGLTALTFDAAVGGSIGLDTASATFTAFNSVPRTKDEYLTYISNFANWTTAEPSTAVTLNITSAVTVPEANTLGLLAFALPVVGAIVARRRK